MDSSGKERVLVVVPARWGSSRFPGKALADLHGRPLVVRVMENAVRMATADRVVTATDDERIAAAVRAAGFEAELTGTHPTGTDRIGEVAGRDPAGIVVNLQGDEPLLDPAVADELVAALRGDPAAGAATCGHPFADPGAWRDPNQVKVVCDGAGRALYFSRAPIPGIFPGSAPAAFAHALRHIGIYAFRRAVLERFLALARTPLEQTEGLEQLRLLEHGVAIRVLRVAGAALGVDTPADLEEVRRRWRDRG